MGARLSQPRGPGGTTESSVPVKAPEPPSPAKPFGSRRINSRTLVAPAAAFTMAILLYVYTRTSIRAAKENAKRHREADSGGEGLSLLNENRRRHGLADRLDKGNNTITQLASEARAQLLGEKDKGDVGAGVDVKRGRSEEEERLRAMKGNVRRRPSSEGG